MSLHRHLVVALLLSLVALGFFVFPFRQPVWDAAVYWGAGKFLLSGGTASLWEPLRPPVLPVVFGLFWLSGLPPLLVFIVLGLALILGFWLLVFDLGKLMGIGDRTSLLLAALSPLLVLSAPRGLSEVPSMVLALLSFWLFAKSRYFFSGIVAAMAFLTKFPMGIVIVGLFVGALSGKNRLKTIFAQSCGFALPVVIFLGVNHFVYGSAFLPFIEGNEVIAESGIWLYLQGPFFYLVEALKENVLLLLFPVGAALAFWRRDRIGVALTVTGLLSLAYFTSIDHKEIRFMVLFLPMCAIVAAQGAQFCIVRLRPHRYVLMFIALVVICQVIYGVRSYSYYDAPLDRDLMAADSGYSVDGVVLVSNPRPALWCDARLDLLYYPIYDAEVSDHHLGDLPSFNGVIISDCDLVCPPEDDVCGKAKQRLLDAMPLSFKESATVKSGGCVWHYFKDRGTSGS
jgi:4-amino-4-deoxy-L-arabinose transferase-like glycosyltransferase